MEDYNKYLNSVDNMIQLSKDPLPKDQHIKWVIYGQTGSGKSNLLLNALRHKIFYKNYFDNIYMCSPTGKNDAKFDKLIEELEQDDRYYNNCSEETTKEIIDKIEEFNDSWDYDKKKRQPRNLIIYDDCLHDFPKATQKNSLINKLITTNRHLKLSIIITSQRYKSMNPLIRINTNIISFFRNNNMMEKKLFCEENSVDIDILDAICEKNHDFMHITYTSGIPLYYDKFNLIN